MRPLVVVSGQGLSLADGFNLVRELESTVPDCFAAVSPNDRSDLDLIVTRLYDIADARSPRADPNTDLVEARNQPASRLLSAIRQLAVHGPADFEKRFPTTADLCTRLGAIASTRLVVLFTTNVDCAGRYGAVGHGAKWIVGDTPAGEATVEAFKQWVTEIAHLAPRFHYFPLHGEPDLVSTGDGRLFAAGLPRPGWFTSLADGLGQGTRTLDQQSSVAHLGYRLLKGLLIGTSSGGSPDPACAADLLVIGYGAGCNDRRDEYPFERTVDDVASNLGATSRGSWAAIARWNHSNLSDQRCQHWFRDRGFTCLPVTRHHSCGDRISDWLA